MQHGREARQSDYYTHLSGTKLLFVSVINWFGVKPVAGHNTGCPFWNLVLVVPQHLQAKLDQLQLGHAQCRQLTETALQ